MKFEMKGSVNGHYFEIEGEGKGSLTSKCLLKDRPR